MCVLCIWPLFLNILVTLLQIKCRCSFKIFSVLCQLNRYTTVYPFCRQNFVSVCTCWEWWCYIFPGAKAHTFYLDIYQGVEFLSDRLCIYSNIYAKQYIMPHINSRVFVQISRSSWPAIGLYSDIPIVNWNYKSEIHLIPWP